jgi:hypothetical protein
MNTRPRKINRGLAAWMTRAGIPSDAIALSFGVTTRSIERAIRMQVRDLERADMVAGRKPFRPIPKRAPNLATWCPPELHGLYHTLCRSSGLSAAEARAVVERDLLGKREAA